MAKLVVIAKGSPGKAHDLSGLWTTIGRSDGNMFQVIEPSVSGRHCEVRLTEEGLHVRDLLSTNGTFIAGAKITEGIVKPGHSLRLGDVELRFENSRNATPGTSFISKMLLTRSGTNAPANIEPEPHNPDADRDTTVLTRADVAKASQIKFHALFVDDSLAFLETFTEVCSELSNQTWKISKATTADRALGVLAEASVDLVVLDIGIPMVDGIQLLGIIKRRYPGLKIAVLTGNPSESNREACLSGDADLFIEKPVSPDGTRIVFNMLNDLMSWTAREGFSGSMREVNLHDLIQMECIAKRSTILEIRNREIAGEICIEAGAVIHSCVGASVGEPAFNQLLSLKGGEFQMKPFRAPDQHTIKQGWEFLLMDAARATDEDTAFLKKSSVKGSTNETAVEEAKDEAEEEFVVVASYDGEWRSKDAGEQ